MPEELWTYDSYYLKRFANSASAAPMPDGRTALELYFKQILFWDIVFAIALALFVALFDFGVATALLPHPYASSILLLLAGMGVLYGAADVAEDLKLASILSGWHRTHRSEAQGSPSEEPRKPTLGQIDSGEAAAANVLTRIKLVAITLSVIGLVIFLVLWAIATLIWRRPRRG